MRFSDFRLFFTFVFALALTHPTFSNWEELPIYGGSCKFGIIIDPNNPDHLFAVAGDAGIYWIVESNDAATTWQTVAQFANSSDIPTFNFLEYIDANTIYAGRLRSFDNGVTWEEIPNNPGWVTAVENKGQETLYAGKCENFGIASPVVYKSIDDGETWSPLGLILNNVEAPKICLSKQSPGVILISIRTLGIYRSSDYGENWTQVLNAGVSQYQIYQHPSRQGCFFAACTAGYFPGVYRSLDDGKTWENMTPGYNARSIGLDPIHEGNVCAYLGDKFGVSGQPGAKLVFFSEDLGQTFSSLGNAPFDQNNGVFILSIAIDSTFDRKIYAGFSQGRGIYRNIGTENNWSACIDEMKAHLVNDIVIDNLDSKILYLCLQSGLLKYSGLSDELDSVGELDLVKGVLFDPFNADRMICYNGEKGSAMGISEDRGISWTFQKLAQFGGAGLRINKWKFSQKVQGQALIGTDGVLYRTIDGGTTLGALLPKRISSIGAGICNDIEYFYCGSDTGGIIRSNSGGEEWVEAGLSQYDITSLQVNPENGLEVYAGVRDLLGSHADVFRTLDGGETWTNITPADVSAGKIYDIEVFAKEDTHVFLAFADKIFFSSNKGDSWELLTTGITGATCMFIQEQSALQHSLADGISYSAPDNYKIFVAMDGGVYLFSGEPSEVKDWNTY